MALANKGLFELTQRPSLTRAVSSSFSEVTEESSCSQVKRPKFCLVLVIFKEISPDYNLVPRKFPQMMTRRPVSTKCGESAQNALCSRRQGSHEQGNGQDLILVFLKTWRLTLKLDSDRTWVKACLCKACTSKAGFCQLSLFLGKKKIIKKISPNSNLL